MDAQQKALSLEERVNRVALIKSQEQIAELEAALEAANAQSQLSRVRMLGRSISNMGRDSAGQKHVGELLMR